MAYLVMAYMGMAYIAVVNTAVAYTAMANIVMAHIEGLYRYDPITDMACAVTRSRPYPLDLPLDECPSDIDIAMAYIFTEDVAMACVVMAYTYRAYPGAYLSTSLRAVYNLWPMWLWPILLWHLELWPI